MAPGSLVYVGKEVNAKVKITQIDFADDFFEEKQLKDITECKTWNNKNLTTWINVEGIHDVAVIESIGKHFGLDVMMLEDIVNTKHRPKFEDFFESLIVVLKTIAINKKDHSLKLEQISYVLGDSWLITFLESGNEHFEVIKNRLKNAMGTIRRRKSDFIFYRLIDTTVDNYFFVTEAFDEKLETLEIDIMNSPDESVNKEIYDVKSQLALLKKTMIPSREAISGVFRSDSKLINAANEKYFRDVYEHIVQIMDTFDSQRETIGDFINLYMSALSNRMNQVMKVLTIFASIFIPLTFIAGVYGMNFKVIPELEWEYGYFVTWGVMIVVAILLLIYFRRKKWL